MDKETLAYIITDFHERSLPQVYSRLVQLPLELDKVVTLVGIRRSGKTSIFFDTMGRLISGGIDKRNILYLNFEDDRLFPIKIADMDLILRTYHELYPDKIGERKYVFLDEVHQVDGWEKYIRRIYDTENVRIFVTGSSSKLVPQQIAASLRGRTISFEIFPLQFSEFLLFRGISGKEYSKTFQAKMNNAFQDFLGWGSFPEIVLTEELYYRQKILREYSDLILYKDLIEHYGIKNLFLLKYLLKHIMVNTAKLFSINRLFNDLKSQGYSVSKDALYEYVGYLQESFILFSVEKYSSSVRVRQQNPSKTYVIDTGLSRVFQGAPHADIGRKLENALYISLRAREDISEIFYYHDTGEVDFIYREKGTIVLANVSLAINDVSTLQREVDSLRNAKERIPKARTLLITHEWKKDLIPSDIEIIPATTFLRHYDG